MKYIIMCGGNYQHWDMPRQLTEINGEPIIARTIRLLKDNSVTDIAISSNHPAFENFGVSVLHHVNPWNVEGYNEVIDGTWVDAFYPTNEPVCYLMGDVVFSPKAIRTIVSTQTDSVEFFASAPPFSDEYKKEYAEPFAFKVKDVQYFKRCIKKVKVLESKGLFHRHPIAWELWQVIKGTPINTIDYTNYTVINDYTCDIDEPEDVKYFKGIV